MAYRCDLIVNRGGFCSPECMTASRLESRRPWPTEEWKVGGARAKGRPCATLAPRNSWCQLEHRRRERPEAFDSTTTPFSPINCCSDSIVAVSVFEFSSDPAATHIYPRLPVPTRPSWYAHLSLLAPRPPWSASILIGMLRMCPSISQVA
jgi:hypothetical protein